MTRGRRSGADLPPNTYSTVSKGRRYYSWRHPITGKRQGIGSDVEAAKTEARRRNADLAGSYGAEVRAHMKIRGKSRNVRRVLETCWNDYLTKRSWSETHLNEVRILRDWYVEHWGQFSLKDVSVRVLSSRARQLSPHAWLKHRQFWIHVFNWAVAEGLVEENPAKKTLRPSPRDLERKRQRLALEDFDRILEAADADLRVAMNVALYSLQRRGDLAKLTREDVVTAGETWLFRVAPSKVQTKTDLHLQIKAPRGSKLRSALSAALAHSLELGSPMLLARKPKRRKWAKGRTHLTQWSEKLLTEGFAKARDAAGVALDLAPEERPSFHEIRALGSHLYRQAGFQTSVAQGLLGHSTEKMTEHYQDDHEVRWVEIDAPL